ncbi:MAG: hypothetical protein HUJ11_02085, partial [Arenibacter algicola]|nr:hypothetical protein [Arenibacter algicola]
MEISIYTSENKKMDSIANFLELYYSFRLKHLASDLLGQGLTTTQFTEDVVKA